MSTWKIDPTHTTVGFSVKHLMISTVRGRFADFTAVMQLDEGKPANSKVEVTVDTGSVDTRAAQRDEHLRSPDFFDVANHPQLTFVSKHVEGDLGGKFRIIGDLTIRGITREVTLNATFDGQGKDPWGNERRAFSATTKINREEFGLLWNQALEAGGLLVSPDVKIEVESEFVKAA